MPIPTVTIQNVCNALPMHAANYGLVWVYNALKSVIGCLRDRQNFSDSSVWHVNTLQVGREHFIKFVSSLLISGFFGRVNRRKTLQMIDEDNSLSRLINTVCFVQLK